MFQVNNKKTRTTSLTFSSVSIVDFDKVNVSWAVISLISKVIFETNMERIYLNQEV